MSHERDHAQELTAMVRAVRDEMECVAQTPVKVKQIRFVGCSCRR